MAYKSVKVDLKGLEKLAKALGSQYSIKVGVIGQKSQRLNGDTGKTNAEIGFINEFGNSEKHIPPRSFLGMPLRLHLAKYLLRKKAFSQKELDKAVRNGTLLELAKKVGIVAEEVIQEAFRTRGFGSWSENRPSTIAKKGSDSPLIDTGQLRRSITSKVDKK